VVVNLITLWQTLIRYDAYCHMYNGEPLSEWYLQKQQWDGAPNSEDYLRALFQLDMLNSIEASYSLKASKEHGWIINQFAWVFLPVSKHLWLAQQDIWLSWESSRRTYHLLWLIHL
jgi:hypothetical protein